MAIWKRDVNLDALNFSSKDTLAEHLQIKYSAFTDSSLSATMPVTSFTHQPFGLLHGGASVVLAETLGSAAANLCVEKGYYCVGLEINANHVKAMRDGLVIGTASAIHIGRQTQIWSIDICNQGGQLVSTSRLTVMVQSTNKS